MKNKQIYKIINEEINKFDFDFLNYDKVNKEETYYDSLNSKEFQTRLIYDLAHNLDTDIFADVTGTYIDTTNDSFNDLDNPHSFELEITLTYQYEDNKFDVTIYIDGEKKDEEEIDYDKTEIMIFNTAGEKISTQWIENDVNLYNVLVDSLVKPYLN